MQLSALTFEQYKKEAPELLDAVTSGEAELIMRRDTATDFCVKYEGGWCGIHKAYGERMLGDACHFFPRATRAVGEGYLMTASMACPEIARLVLVEDAPASMVEAETGRLPDGITQYATEELDGEACLLVHQAFLAHVRHEGIAVERAMAHIMSVARSMAMLPKAQWPAAVAFYLRSADGRLPTPEPDARDPFHVLNALQGLIAAAPKTQRPRLMETVEAMARVLMVELDWEQLTLSIGEQGATSYIRMHAYWRDHCAEYYTPVLRRWLEAELSLGFFPFAGLGGSAEQRAVIVAVRLATVRLALMATCFEKQALLAEDELVRVVQSLARFLDHLADPSFSLRIYDEVGWTREARLRALLGDG